MEPTADNKLSPWNLSTEIDYEALAKNWNMVDAHDMTTGRGIQIPTGGVEQITPNE